MIKLWFGFSAAVDRTTYIKHGFLLMGLKYVVDAAISSVITDGRFLDPLTYLHPLISYRYEALFGTQLDSAAAGAGWTLATLVWTLPFIWIGVSMSARRALDAGMSIWLALLFFIPVVNFLLITILSIQGSAPPQNEPRRERQVEDASHLVGSATKAVGFTSILGVGLVSLMTLGFESYGSGLFLGTPFVMGVWAAYLVHRPAYRGWKTGLTVSWLSIGLCAGLMIVFALEGALCLVMAAPIAMALATLGALAAGAMVKSQERFRRSAGAMVLAIPFMSAVGVDQPPEWAVRSAISSIEISAPPEVVWPNVVGFSELPPPSDWILRTGVAVPLRARIEGQGVGAIRYCEFTTGPFVEPITVWEQPKKLGFDVVESPPSMTEWSPYQVVHAPHLMGNMLSRRGQFELIPLPNGRTQLIGTTWYTLDMSPGVYWSLWSDLLVHRIHGRVLKHIKHLSEADKVKVVAR